MSHEIAIAKQMVKQGELIFFPFDNKNLNDPTTLKTSGRIQNKIIDLN